MTLIINY